MQELLGYCSRAFRLVLKKFASVIVLYIFTGKPYRYFYAISSDVDAVNPGAVRFFAPNNIIIVTENH